LRLRFAFIQLLFVFLTISGHAQNQQYGIFWGDDEIGSLSVSRVKKGAKTDINFIADVEFRVIVKYNRRTEYKASFIKDTLQFASTRSVMNDKLKDYQTTKREKNHYQIFKHPSEKSILKEMITQTVAMLYFKEPKNDLRRIYAEGQSKFCKLEGLGAGKYKLHLDDNKENIYTYKAGKLEQVEVNRTWFDLIFKRVD
jgi:hypothetical protein